MVCTGMYVIPGLRPRFLTLVRNGTIRETERERETTLTARLDAGKSPLFFLEPRRLSLSLSRRGEEKQVIRFKGFSGSDVNGAWLKCSFWQERGPWIQRLVIRFLRPVRPLEFSTPSVGISRGFRCRSFCLHVFCSKIFWKFSIELKDEIFNIVSRMNGHNGIYLCLFR